jgi:preprotein translocase subunit SecY
MRPDREWRVARWGPAQMTQDLARRVAFTVGALLIYRLGQYIPLPGIDAEAWAILSRSQGSGVAAALGTFSSGARRMAICALGIVPYVSAAVLVQLATIVSRRLRAIARDGERGRRRMVRYALHLALLLAAFQAWGVARALEQAGGVVTNPGSLFVVSAVVTLTGGTMFLVWLAEQITVRGVGNGIAVILLAGVVTQVPGAIAYTLELGRQGVLSTQQIGVLSLVVVAVTALVVTMELARRKLPIRYPDRQVGSRQLDERVSELALKLNPAGIVPVLLASFVLSILIAVAAFLTIWGSSLLADLRPDALPHLIVYALLIVFCTFLYTASVLDPDEAAEKLKGFGGVLPTIEPGEATASYIDRVVSRTTVVGSAYLALICVLPEVLRFVPVPFYLGGVGLLVAVCTIIDLAAQFRARLVRP